MQEDKIDISKTEQPDNAQVEGMNKKRVMNEIVSFGKEFVVALVVSIIITQFVFTIPLVPSGSMLPTIGINERILVEKVSKWYRAPQRGDIVVFPYPDDPSELYVKRVIGLPGERVEIYSGNVWINGVALEEPYLVESTYGVWDTYDVPEDSIFALGDNRQSSNDGRRWRTTNYVKIKDIQGRGIAVLWPIQAVRFMK